MSILEDTINKFEPVGDIDRMDLGDGMETGKPALLDVIYNSVRRMPLRKMVALITFICDLLITITGVILQYSIPDTILSNWNSCKTLIYGFYFSSSAVETIAGKAKSTFTSSPSKPKFEAKKVEGEDKYLDDKGNEIPILKDVNEEP